MTPDHALDELLRGNRRFAEGKAERPRQDPTRRAEVAVAQHPLAVVVGCADSRVPPEILFDTGIGDLFVLRTAGHLVDDRTLGGIEFGVSQFGPQLIVVLAHTRCGAVLATLAALRGNDRPAGALGTVVDALAPAIRPVAAADTPQQTAILANLEVTVQTVRTASPLIAERLAAGNLRVVGMLYDLESGAAELIIS